MDRLEQIKNEVAREYDFDNWKDASSYLSDDNEGNQAVAATIDVEGMVNEVARRYATEVSMHNLERAAGQAAIEVESRLSGKTIHGSINSEDPQWVARVNRESITSLEIELI